MTDHLEITAAVGGVPCEETVHLDTEDIIAAVRGVLLRTFEEYTYRMESWLSAENIRRLLLSEFLEQREQEETQLPIGDKGTQSSRNRTARKARDQTRQPTNEEKLGEEEQATTKQATTKQAATKQATTKQATKNPATVKRQPSDGKDKPPAKPRGRGRPKKAME